MVYVGASLTYASDAHRKFFADFKEALRMATPALILEWLGPEPHHIPPHEFYELNMNNVRRSDAMIAIVDEPSIGLGMEIGEAIVRNRPLLCIHKQGARISRLLSGARDGIGIPVEPYRDLPHAVEIATAFIDALSVPATPTAAA